MRAHARLCHLASSVLIQDVCVCELAVHDKQHCTGGRERLPSISSCWARLQPGVDLKPRVCVWFSFALWLNVGECVCLTGWHRLRQGLANRAWPFLLSSLLYSYTWGWFDTDGHHRNPWHSVCVQVSSGNTLYCCKSVSQCDWCWNIMSRPVVIICSGVIWRYCLIWMSVSN